MKSTLSSHRLFQQFKPYLRIETYAPDGGHKHPRIRIEWKSMPPMLRQMALAATMPCVSCGQPINFIRSRNAESKRSTSGHLYYACSCPLSVSIGCSRGAAAKDEYLAVRAENGG
jgi:hypothetical protein